MIICPTFFSKPIVLAKEEIESYLNDSPLISEALVIGIQKENDDETYVNAQIFPNMDAIKEYLKGTVPTKEEVKKILGDINDDKKINSVDCILMIKIILGENANVHNLDFQKRADLNNDGQVNILDAILIRTYILKSF